MGVDAVLVRLPYALYFVHAMVGLGDQLVG